MKIRFISMLLFIAVLTSCAAKKLSTTTGSPAKSYLAEYVANQVKEGKTTENPLLVIDGFEFTVDQLDLKGSSLTKRDIYQIYCLEKDKDIATRVYGEKGKRGVILVTTNGAHEKGVRKDAADNVLVFVGNKKITMDEMRKIDPMDIDSIDVIKSKSGIKKYTRKKYDGVILIRLKDGKTANL